MTSPFTERCMSVTSSGRSSISSTMRYTSGGSWRSRWRGSGGAPSSGARRGDDEPRWPLPIGTEQIHGPRGEVVRVVLEPDPLHRIERRQVVEQRLVTGLFGRLEVDRLDLEQGEVALGVLRRSHLPGDRVAGAEIETPNLRRETRRCRPGPGR
jgi:hypothetical protein